MITEEFLNAVRQLLIVLKTDAQPDIIQDAAERVDEFLLEIEIKMAKEVS